MASLPPTWASISTSRCHPSSAAASSGAKFLSLPTRRYKYQSGLSASSSHDGACAGETDTRDRVQLAFSKAKAYRKDKNSATPSPPSPPSPPASDQKPSMEPSVGSPKNTAPETEVPVAAKLAMGKANDYKKNKNVSLAEPRNPGVEDVSLRNSRKSWVDNKFTKKDGINISSKDFLGLDFSEKKSYRGKSPDLDTQVGYLLEGDVPEVEIIVGDPSKFEKTTTRVSTSEAVDSTGLYKPKVSTWGVFPRPNNISKTFGGGRVIDSGEMLETPEVKNAKEKRSRDLIVAYKRKRGLTIDAKTRADCEKLDSQGSKIKELVVDWVDACLPAALIEGDSLMDLGQLRGALPYYEKVMKTLIFQTELHGLAALQWSICQDSLSGSNEARSMYEKLKSHPNAEVRKKARQFIFSFQAMEMLNVKDTSFPKKTGFEDYFEAFVDYKAGYTPSVEEQSQGVLEQVFPYLILLLSLVFIILFIAIKKSF